MRAVTGSTALRFRAATPADVPAIVALVESAYRGDSSRAGWTTEADLLDGQRTDAEGVLALVAQPPGREDADPERTGDRHGGEQRGEGQHGTSLV